MRAGPRVFIASVMIVAACLAMAPAASAVSLQVRAGTDSSDNGEGSNVALDLFFYEGRSFDFYLGYDSISASDEHSVLLTTGIARATTTARTTAFILGLRYKMQTEYSWKPYVSFGMTFLDTTFAHQPGLESYYEGPFERSTSGILLGLGVDVGISNNWSLGLEGTILTGVPYYSDAILSTGSVGRALNDDGDIMQVDLGLRYHFD
jgi:Outer membrane protein beta-barrel domain